MGCMEIITDEGELANLPDGSVLINVRGNTCRLDTLVDPRDASELRIFEVTGQAEDWPLTRLGLPAKLLFRGDDEDNNR